ncbi:Cytochrome P450 [Corchorus olitorius]|uniref:Cytochrome P450 n=1 Tax=Corchorus olitorius TaxID=93759 RepID=A0A1R3H7T2_9ROSI|nr:Cytochrome P450 [Corchorus olitorius]
MASTPLYYYYGSSLLAFFFCTYLVQTLIKKLFSHVRTGVQLKHLPSPPSLPIIGHLHYFLLGSTSFAKKLQSLATRYGPLLQLNMGASTFILVSNANSAREILKTHELNFVYRSDFGTRDDNIYFGSGIIVAPYGTYWRYLKKLCMTKLLSTSQLNQFTHIREQEIMKFLQYLIKVSKEDEFCDLGVPITALINNVICRMAMSTSPWDDTGKSEKIKELIDEMGELAGKLSAGDILGPLNKFDLFGYGRKLKKAQAEFDELVEGIMKKHEENGSTEGRDLMDIMLETCNDPSAEVKLTRTDVKAFFRTLIKMLFNYVDLRGVHLQNPPTPPSLPVIGHLHHFLLGSGSFVKKFHSLATQYGPLLQLNMGASTFILVSNANFAREILKNQELNFVDRPDFGSNDDNMYFGSGIIVAPYGSYWRFLKKLCMTKLLFTTQLNQFTYIREQEIMKLLQYLIKVSKENEFCDLSGPITALMNTAICRMAMSTNPSDDAAKVEKIKMLVDEMGELAGKLSAGDMLGPLKKLDLFGYGRKLKKALKEFDELAEEMIMKKHDDNGLITGKQGRDLMDILLETSNDPSADVKLTRTDVKAFLRDVFTAGTETSSTAVKWSMAELINHPQVFKKLRQEIFSVVGHGRLVKESDLQNLPYLQAVVKETLRLHPPSITVHRLSNEPCKIHGFNLKAKTRIIVNLYTIMRDPGSWDKPDEFIPERFMVNSNPDQIGLRGQNFDFLPFGSGRRACPGASLAMIMIPATVGALVQCFDWKVKGGEMVDMTEASSFAITLEMATPLVCYPVLHFNPFKQA